MNNMDIQKLTIHEAAKGLADKAFSATELTAASLTRIKERNSSINAFISFDEASAMAAAKAADDRIAAGKATALTGIPFGAKDAICTKDMRSTGAAKILDNYVPAHQATVIDRILKEGAVLVGKQNCDTFGHGASNENSMYGPVKNPHDETKVAGGSSGGSAAAVADGQVLFSIAEDTGGSIRQPAAFNGIAGLRPSYGRNSRFGIMPMASSLDTVGPMAHTVKDIALLMNVMAGHDPLDHTSVPDAVPNYLAALDQPIAGVTVGIPEEYFNVEGTDPETIAAVENTITLLQDAGAIIKSVSLPHTKYAVPTYYIIVPSEDSSNLGRIDAIRYGVQKAADSLEDVYADSRQTGMPEEVKRRIMIGTYALSAGYYDAYYRKAQKVRTLIKQDFEQVFANEVDVLLTPTSPFPAFGIGEKQHDTLAMYAADVFVGPAALAGMPGISINAGLSKAGLPIGVQLIGARLDEARVLQVAYHLETLLNA